MRVVIQSADARWAREAQARLAARGVDARAEVGPVEARRAEAPSPDVLALDASGEVVEEACARAAAARRAPGGPLAVVGLVGAGPAPSHGVLARSADLDALIDLEGDAPLPRQIASAFRLGVCRREVDVRRAAGAALNVAAPAPSMAAPPRILFVGPPDPFFLALEAAVADRGGRAAAALTSFAAFDQLHDDAFDAVVLNARRDAGPAMALCGALRRNADLHETPTLMLLPADGKGREDAYARGACAVACVGDDRGRTIDWLFEDIRRARAQILADEQLAAWRTKAQRGAAGLVSRAFLDQALIHQVDNAHAGGRTLALAVLRVSPAIGATRPSGAAWRRGFAEAGSLAARLVRSSDLVSALDEETLVVSFAASSLQEAETAVERIAAVGECTAFALAGEGEAPLVFGRSVVGLLPGESAQALLVRGLDGLSDVSVRA